MNFSQQVLCNIKQLQRLEEHAQTPGSERLCNKSTFKKIEELRKKIPTTFLGHHDRLRLRGKKSVAPVCNNVCGACHLQIPRGVVLRMQKSSEFGMCDHCGAFIYLSEPEEVVWQESPKAKKSRSKHRITAAKGVV